MFDLNDLDRALLDRHEEEEEEEEERERRRLRMAKREKNW